MVAQEMTEVVAARLAKVYAPQKVFFFGSYAWGEPGPDSDLDLLVVVEEAVAKMAQRSLAGRCALRDLRLAKDILVYTAAEFNQLVQDPASMAFKIQQEGKLLYEKS